VEFRRPLPEHWEIRYDALGLTFKIRPTSFKHTGLFPEQAVNWDWIDASVRGAGGPVSVLNLFGYTGAATCAAAAAGAAVCHVDAAEGMVKWCKENAALAASRTSPSATLPTTPQVRPARGEARPALRRGHHGPPDLRPREHGRALAPRGPPLGAPAGMPGLLSDKPLFFLINAYTARLSPRSSRNLLTQLLHDLPGTSRREVGLPIQRDGKVLPCGIYGRWKSRT